MVNFAVFVSISMISDGLILGAVPLEIQRWKQKREQNQAAQATARKLADRGRYR
jgi:hypothetical protein